MFIKQGEVDRSAKQKLLKSSFLLPNPERVFPMENF
jgi:hypothetical protein